MSDRTYVIISDRPWNQGLPERLQRRCEGAFVLINQQSALTVECLDALSPHYVFFPHWSYKIPASLHERFECIVFHMTDVPYGRGGSPLQNLIVRGHVETVVSALKCIEEMDAGPVYLKRPLCLHGSAEEIFLRASTVIEEMIVEIIEKQPEPRQQTGEPTIFKRRQPEDGDLSRAKTENQLYDMIRMLDAEGYPAAYLECGNFRFEFDRATLQTDGVKADVIVKQIK